MPDPVPLTKVLEPTALERQQYDKIIEDTSRAIQLIVSKRGTRKLNSTVLESLLKLRLFCNNGSGTQDEEIWKNGFPSDPDEVLSLLQQKDMAVCIYCSGNIYSINDSGSTDGGLLIPDCMHLVCRGCMPQYYYEKRKCRKCASGASGRNLEESQVRVGFVGDSDVQVRDPGSQQPHEPIYSTKMLTFLNDIQQDIQTRSNHKSIAFSSWKKTLDIAGQLLESRGIKSCCIHGSLPLSVRLEVLRNFRLERGGVDVLLMTLGTGAVGLNLAVATRVYLFEPQWNPAIELQAVGRALRLGQAEQVTVIRYIMRGTVEDSNVLSRQNKKLQLADGGFSKKRQGMSSERHQAISDMFGIDLEP